ncbi:conserved hypothetical protein [Methylocella tundrae]|nr:conserved hypothetical protein [Methylocella tundrae]
MRHKLRNKAVRAGPPLRSLLLGLASWGLALSASPLCALTLDSPQAVLGQWELSLEGSNKTCRLTLRGEQIHGGFYIGMPAGCRRALPVLSNIVAWGLPDSAHLDLADVNGAPLLYFTMENDALVATGTQGETYRLTFVVSAPGHAAAAPDALRLDAAPPAAAPVKAAPLRSADVPGRYAVLREGGRDTGCMVTLDVGGKAFLSPACRDQGIVIFDPMGWRLAGGRLVLRARKGHTAQLDLQPDGSWLKDPKDAKSLALKKL